MQREICDELGVGAASLARWIAADPERPARVREARIAAARFYEERAGQVIEEADDQFSLAKAKELAHHYRWKASKASPKEFGDKVETVVSGSLDQNLSVSFVTASPVPTPKVPGITG